MARRCPWRNDAEGSRVAGFPYLRSNRLLASFRGAGLDGAGERAWHEAMLQLDREGRLVEIANLPPAATREVLAALHAEGFAALPRATGCAALLPCPTTTRPGSECWACTP